MRRVALFVCALLLAAPAGAKERKIIDPLAEGLVAQNHVAAVEVKLGPTIAPKMADYEAKAAQKRAAAGLGAVAPGTPAPVVTSDAAAAPAIEANPATSDRPSRDIYATLPFATMMPLVMEDVTRDWGLKTGRPVKLTITIDNLKFANAGMAMLIGSSDQLAGLVEVSDPASGAKLGSFYVDVINSHGGLLGLAMRGAGIREKLAEEFALQTSRVLTGRKSKTPKA